MARSKAQLIVDDDPLWYKDAIIYEVHVRSFYDSDGDGIGDFRGLTQKLDYLQDLGVTAIWLLPFYPSPLKDDGYDIADYTDIHPNYGTLRDFKAFIREAKRRGLRVITELVVNHTSDQHPWFQRARRARPGSPERRFYVWSDSPTKYADTRIIFKDFESSNWTWDQVAQAYYWHRFYSHQPDLNYDSPQVRKAIIRVLNFWLKLGVDGLRLDAVPYLFERENTNCENLPETHIFLKDLRKHVDQKFKNRMFLAEANQWPEDAAAYFGEGDECHMAFHFPLMPRLFMALRMEDRFPIIDILQQTPAIPENCQWALFLRNHDELTLEMVTDEDRDYMNRVYAQDPQMRINLGIRRRLAPLLGNHRRRIELMKTLLFSMPGTPVIYYGDEIGMGDNFYLGDRDGVRTPMQWSSDLNAGFSRANPQRLYLPVILEPEYHYKAINVDTQQNNPHSLLWWIKRFISLRKRYKAFGRGSIEFLYPENRKVIIFLRRYQEECILVVTNLSRFVQYVELDLSAFQGKIPVELIARHEFPAIGELPYFITLGPHCSYWFALESPQRLEVELPTAKFEIPTLAIQGEASELFLDKNRAAMAEVLPNYLQRCRWFGGKARQIKSARILEIIPFTYDGETVYLVMVSIGYIEGEPESYVLPLAVACGERIEQILRENPQAVVARLQYKERLKLLYEAIGEVRFGQALFDSIARRRHFKGMMGELSGSTTRVFRQLRAPAAAHLEPAIMKAEQSNTSIVYGDQFILKLYRRVEEGINPDLEIGRFLTEKTRFTNFPPVAGALEYRRNRSEPMTMAVLQGFVLNQGDAWEYTLDVLGHYYETALARKAEVEPELPSPSPFLAPIMEPVPPLAQEMIGHYLESARLLGQRTAELHLALASVKGDPNFAPEPFSALYQRSVYQSMRNLTARTFQLMRSRLRYLPETMLAEAQQVLELEGEVFKRFRSLIDHKISTMRIRVHGDYHLGQVLYTGKDFVIIDFEGEPARSLTERRLKRSPLRDIAGMLRSFHYAVNHAILTNAFRPEDVPAMEKWAQFWQLWVSSIFLQNYFAVAAQGAFLPSQEEELQVLLKAYCLEKAIYELAYELNNRPDWVKIPLRGILQLLEISG
ncbi:MAG: maltose alpha-D-glucosyltransferase [Desulfobacteraceae bacterium]